MPLKYKIYKIEDFIRKNQTGELDRDRIESLINEIIMIASYYPNHNILIDSRDTTISYEVYMTDILEAAERLAQLENIFLSKIANIVPKDEARLSIANTTEAAINLKGIKYKIFTEFEDAIEWISKTRN